MTTNRSSNRERLHDRLRTVLAVGLIAALLAPAVAPAAQAAYSVLERRQTIEVVHVADDEPEYVAEQVQAFADDAGLPYRERAVETRGELLSAIRASDADMLVVAGHGATRRAGPGSGIEAGDGVARRAAIVEAIEDSGARRFFFAVCGLGLPETVDGRSVSGYDGYVDMKVAAVGALSDIGFLYSRSTAEEMLPTFRTAVDRVASEEELIVRMVQPQDPLHDHANGDDPSCYDSWHNGTECDWSSESEENGTSRQRSETGAWPKLGGFFDIGETLKLTWDDGQWDFLVEIAAPDCIDVYEVDGLSVPGYDVQEQISKLPGVKADADAFELEVCGSVYLGIPSGGDSGGQGEASGEVIIKGGSELELKIQFGWAHIEIEAWIGLTAPLTLSLTVEDSETDDHDGLEWTLEFDATLNFVAQAEWGYIDAGVYAELGSFNACWGTSCDGSQETSAQDPSIGGLPSVPGSDARLQVATQTLTRANVNHLADHPSFADRLSAAIGRDAAELPVGARLNLRNASVCDAIYGDDPLCRYAASSVDAIVGGSGGPALPTSSGSGGSSGSGNNCTGEDGECGNASSTEQRTYRQACAQLRNATNGSAVGKRDCPVRTLPVNSFKTCMEWTGSRLTCRKLAFIPSAQDIVKKRSMQGLIGAMVPNINEAPDRGLHKHDVAVVLRSPCERVWQGVPDDSGFSTVQCQLGADIEVPEFDEEGNLLRRIEPPGVNLKGPVEYADWQNERIRASMAFRETGEDASTWTQCALATGEGEC